MSDLGLRLERLGLSQYLVAFIGEGFDTWDTVLDITESDLSSLNVKLGHRRKLQRAIAEARGQIIDRPSPIALNKAASVEGSYRSDDSGTESRFKAGESSSAGVTTSTKRKYRRHPRPDEHAPERPPSAYVIFSNQVRETLRGQDLSFTEIAKVVGERWQVLPSDAREGCERQANTAKEKYYTMLAEYKKTSQYDSYQKYLEDFRAKHAPPPKEFEGKRTKIDALDSGLQALRANVDHSNRGASRRVSAAHSDHIPGHQRSGSDPPLGPARLPAGPSGSSMSPSATSPTVHMYCGINAARASERYSPVSASPRPASLQKENSFESSTNTSARDYRAVPEVGLPFSSSAHGQTTVASPTTTYSSHYQTPVELTSRRTVRDSSFLPPLSHEDTTLSSDSGGQAPQVAAASIYTGPLLPVLDAPKNLRVLPTPVPTAGAAPSPLDRLVAPPFATSQQQQHLDFRNSASLAALLRASELARVADDEEMEA